MCTTHWSPGRWTLIIYIANHEVSDVYCFFSTVRQADALHEFAGLNVVVNLHLPQKFLVEKAISRRMCEHCGDTYVNICILHCISFSFDNNKDFFNSPCSPFLFSSYNLANIQHYEFSMPAVSPNRPGLCDKVEILNLSFLSAF